MLLRLSRLIISRYVSMAFARDAGLAYRDAPRLGCGHFAYSEGGTWQYEERVRMEREGDPLPILPSAWWGRGGVMREVELPAWC